MSVKYNLLGMPKNQLEDFFTHIGENKFRAHQVMKWIHHHSCDDFFKMSNISKALQQKLAQLAVILPPSVVKTNEAKDGTIKWIIEVASGSLIETILIPHGDNRRTLCISSQAGCILDCSFCSTGKQGFNSNLTTAEIIGQVWLATKHFGGVPATINRTVTNIVLMGMGEPLLNFGNVVNALSIMMDDLGYGISKRKVTLSTSGVAPKIIELAKYTDASLALSLHAPNDALRDQLVPLNKKYKLREVLDACNVYMKTLGDKRVLTIEYVLLKNVNEQKEHADELAILLKDIPCKINLIPFNPFFGSQYNKPDIYHIMKFQKRLQEKGFNVTIRTTRGDEIDAACGQLVGEITDKTRRQERYYQKISCILEE